MDAPTTVTVVSGYVVMPQLPDKFCFLPEVTLHTFLFADLKKRDIVPPLCTQVDAQLLEQSRIQQFLQDRNGPFVLPGGVTKGPAKHLKKSKK